MSLFNWLRKERQIWAEIKDKPAPNPGEEERVALLLVWLRSSSDVTQKRGDEVITQICYTWEGYFAPSFVEAVLLALQDNEFVRFLPSLHYLVKQGARSAEQKRVLTAAQSCITLLEQKEQEQILAETLLRPSSSMQEHNSELLRPAHSGNVSSNSDQLLRSIENSHEL